VQIPSRTDLKQLCEVSKTLYNIAIPKLYANIVIWAEDEWHLERVEVEPFLRTSSKLTSPLDHVRSVQVRSRFHHLLEERCLHHKDIGFYMGEPDSERQPRFEKLTTHLIPLFEQLREESLQSFRFAIIPRLSYLTAELTRSLQLGDGHLCSTPDPWRSRLYEEQAEFYRIHIPYNWRRMPHQHRRQKSHRSFSISLPPRLLMDWSTVVTGI